VRVKGKHWRSMGWGLGSVHRCCGNKKKKTPQRPGDGRWAARGRDPPPPGSVCGLAGAKRKGLPSGGGGNPSFACGVFYNKFPAGGQTNWEWGEE